MLHRNSNNRVKLTLTRAQTASRKTEVFPSLTAKNKLLESWIEGRVLFLPDKKVLGRTRIPRTFNTKQQTN